MGKNVHKYRCVRRGGREVATAVKKGKKRGMENPHDVGGYTYKKKEERIEWSTRKFGITLYQTE